MPETGAERYLNKRREDPNYDDNYKEAARQETMTYLTMILGEPDEQNGRAPYVSMFWRKRHISATVWKDGYAGIHIGGTHQEIIEAARVLREVPLSGFMPQDSEEISSAGNDEAPSEI